MSGLSVRGVEHYTSLCVLTLRIGVHFCAKEPVCDGLNDTFVFSLPERVGEGAEREQ